MVEFAGRLDVDVRASRRRYFELLEILVARHLKVRYRGSVLGIYWSLLNPVVMTAIYTAVFGANLAKYYGDSIFDYAIAVFVGLTVINLFQGSTAQALTSLVGSGQLLNKIRLPINVFPLSFVASYFVQFAMGSFVLLVGLTLWTSHSIVNAVALLLPITALAMICVGASLLVSGLYVFFRDLPYFYELIVFVLWITSPIFYPSAIVPDKIRSFLAFNPLAVVVESTRQIALSATWPNLDLAGRALLAGVIVLGVGSFAFRSWRNRFMDML